MADLTDIQKQIEAVDDKIDERIAKAEEEIQNAGDMARHTKQEIEGLIDEWKDLQEEREALRKQVDEHAKTISKLKKRTVDHNEGALTFAKHLHQRFSESESYQAFKSGRRKSITLDISPFMTRKDTMTTGSSLTGEVIEPDRVDGVFFPPERPAHVREFIATGTTTSDTIRYIEETGYTDNTDTVAEGEMKPESEIDLEAKDAPVRTIAHTMRVSNQMLDDIDFLSSYLGQRMRFGIRKEEDEQILYGDGTGENLTGISQYAETAFDNSRLDEDVTSPQDIDVLRYAQLQARLSEFIVDAAMLNPRDFARMESLKDDQDRYLDQLDRLGFTIVENTAVNEGDFFVGSFATGGVIQLFDRQQTELRIFEQDRDNVPRNLTTFRAEERLALPFYRPEGVVHDSFTDALTFA